jgi:hypothetical protein
MSALVELDPGAEAELDRLVLRPFTFAPMSKPVTSDTAHLSHASPGLAVGIIVDTNPVLNEVNVHDHDFDCSLATGGNPPRLAGLPGSHISPAGPSSHPDAVPGAAGTGPPA